MKRDMVIGIVLMAIGFASVYCSTQTTRKVLDATEAACVLIPVVVEDGRVQSVCATIEELTPFARRLASASASVSASASPTPAKQ